MPSSLSHFEEVRAICICYMPIGPFNAMRGEGLSSSCAQEKSVDGPVPKSSVRHFSVGRSTQLARHGIFTHRNSLHTVDVST